MSETIYTTKQIYELLNSDNEIDYVIVVNEVLYDVSGIVISIINYLKDFDLYAYIGEPDKSNYADTLRYLLSEHLTSLLNRMGYAHIYVENFMDLLPLIVDVRDRHSDAILAKIIGKYVGENKVLRFWQNSLST